MKRISAKKMTGIKDRVTNKRKVFLHITSSVFNKPYEIKLVFQMIQI